MKRRIPHCTRPSLPGAGQSKLTISLTWYEGIPDVLPCKSLLRVNSANTLYIYIYIWNVGCLFYRSSDDGRHIAHLKLHRPRQPVRPRYSGHRWNNRSLDYFLEQRWKIHGSMSAVSLEFRPPYCFCYLRLKFMPVTRIFCRLSNMVFTCHC